MNQSGFPSEPFPRPSARPDNCKLHIVQQPERARVVAQGKERDRKPIDPPPVVQLHINDNYNSICSFQHNPYLFCACTLYDPQRDEPKQGGNDVKGPALTGSRVSSLWKLKDLNNSENGFFVFGDLCAQLLGKARLHFALYEYRPGVDEVAHLQSATSQIFEVSTAKDWDGVKESTVLSRTFADQGVRLRLRKESRNSARTFMPPASVPPGSNTQTPIRPHPGASAGYGALSSPDPSADHPSKRHKSYASSMSGSYYSPTYGSQPNTYQGSSSSPYGMSGMQQHSQMPPSFDFQSPYGHPQQMPYMPSHSLAPESQARGVPSYLPSSRPMANPKSTPRLAPLDFSDYGRVQQPPSTGYASQPPYGSQSQYGFPPTTSFSPHPSSNPP